MLAQYISAKPQLSSNLEFLYVTALCMFKDKNHSVWLKTPLLVTTIRAEKCPEVSLKRPASVAVGDRLTSREKIPGFGLHKHSLKRPEVFLKHPVLIPH